MLDQLFPRVHRTYTSLPIQGTALDDFARWLFEEGLPAQRVRQRIRATRRIERALRHRGVRQLDEITREQLHDCAPVHARDNPDLAAALRSFERYLDVHGLLPAPPAPTKTEALIASYGMYLLEVRGLTHATVAQHRWAARQLLESVGYEDAPARLSALGAIDIEAFVRTTGERVGRATLQHAVARLRAFLRFLATRAAIKPGLDAQIDTPRLYRGERLPRSLPWKTVRVFLASIDRNSRCGMRATTPSSC